MSLSQGKIAHMKRLANGEGVIAAAAMDQRGSLRSAFAKARGVDQKEIPDAMLSEFKTSVTKILTPHATAILLDPEYGTPAFAACAKNAGLIVSYEYSGYDNTRPGRLPDLLPGVSVRRIKEMGGDAVKILIYYHPRDDKEVNEIKHAFIERIGAECEFYEIPFFLEFIGYDPKGGEVESLAFAKTKPEVVKGSMAEFTKDKYYVDVLKVEVPVNAKYVEGSTVLNKAGEVAYSKAEATALFNDAASVATKPFIYLSAGVDNDVFAEQLAMAAESGAPYSGVLCGRATWKEGMDIYAKQGVAALEKWLSSEGVKNIQNVNNALKGARPWFEKFGLAAV